MANARALDANNDIFVQDGSFRRVSDGAEVVQNLRSRLLLYLGEWFLDTTVGVPYFDEIFVKPFDIKVAESIIISEILNTDGINTLIRFNSEFDGETRKWQITFTAETTFGLVENETINLTVI